MQRRREGAAPGLSKSRFQAGIQCPRQLWLRCFRPELADPITAQQQALFDTGHRVGALARERFPGGVLVTETYRQSKAALRTTAGLIGGGAACLCEGAFEYDGIFVRPDILCRGTDGRWDLVEVKSTNSLKEEHISDVAVQMYVLKGAGLPVGRAFVMHLNGEYVYPGGDYDLGGLFSLEDVTGPVSAFAADVPDLVASMKRMLAGPCPGMAIGRRCHKPYDCGFIGYCHGFLPEHPVTEIPRLSDDVLRALLEDGIACILDVPALYPGLSPGQRSMCACVRSGRPWFGPELGHELDGVRFPAHFLDFETFQTALPVYPGTRPYQQVPVQWSCHTVHEDVGAGGRMVETEHHEFIHAESTDPRTAFAESLLAAVEGKGSVVVYSGFERRILGELARDFPEFAARIGELDRRLFDLEQVIRAHVQHPDFHGRTSLKYVLPALVADLSYDGLAIQNGRQAMMQYERAVFGGLPAAEREVLCDELKAYCVVDTLGLVRVYEVLRTNC